MMDLQIEMNLNKVQVARNGYTILDVLSDVGGIQGLLQSFCWIIIGIWNYKNFDNYMASRLYKLKDKKKSDTDGGTMGTDGEGNDG